MFTHSLFPRLRRTLLLPLGITFGDVDRVPSAPADLHFIIRASDVDSATKVRLTTLLEAERPRVLSDLGMSSAGVVTIDMYTSYGALAAAAAQRGVVLTPGIPGFAFGAEQVHVLSPATLAWSRLEDTVSYLVHEFTHCVMVQRNPGIETGPRWFSEAVATYEARFRKDPRRWAWLVDSRTPSLSAMNDPQDARPIEVGYTVGEFIVQRWGTRAFGELIDRGGRVDQALGLSQARFEEEWYAWLRRAYNM